MNQPRFSDDPDELLDRIYSVRKRLSADVVQARTKVAAATDWHSYVPRSPWVWTVGGIVVTALVIPRLRRAAKAKALEHHAAEFFRQQNGAREATVWGAVGSAVSALAIRAAVNWATNRFIAGPSRSPLPVEPSVNGRHD